MTETIATIAFWVFSIATIVGGLGVVAARRVFHSALFLAVALTSTAAIYVLLSADFLAAVQILVYAGAIVILVLFAIMLTPQSVELPSFAPGGQQFAGAVMALGLLGLIVAAIATSPWPLAAQPLDTPTTGLIGTDLLTTYMFPFELASLVLLVAMIGAILLARED
jgi:NADH:ubiquinone oxidoreductase subunit 6 (subunit J)